MKVAYFLVPIFSVGAFAQSVYTFFFGNFLTDMAFLCDTLNMLCFAAISIIEKKFNTSVTFCNEVKESSYT